MSTALVFAKLTHNTKASMRLKAAAAPSPTRTAKPADKQPEENEVQLRWSFSEMALDALRKEGSDSGSAISSLQPRAQGLSRSLPGRVRNLLDSSAGERPPATVADVFSRKFGSDLSRVTSPVSASGVSEITKGAGR